jgi:uracil-DNA glycosylase
MIAIQDFGPDLVVPVGRLAINGIIPGASDRKLDEIIGRKYTLNPLISLKSPIPVIPLPHPSGRSSWVHTHSGILNRSQTLLKTEIQI